MDWMNLSKGDEWRVDYKEILEKQIKLLEDTQTVLKGSPEIAVCLSRQIQSLTECLIDRSILLGK